MHPKLRTSRLTRAPKSSDDEARPKAEPEILRGPCGTPKFDQGSDDKKNSHLEAWGALKA